ncbi:hypothetical protein [Gloeocapsa sp. PCC 7428]
MPDNNAPNPTTLQRWGKPKLHRIPATASHFHSLPLLREILDERDS